jgi:hypothetical protein
MRLTSVLAVELDTNPMTWLWKLSFLRYPTVLCSKKDNWQGKKHPLSSKPNNWVGKEGHITLLRDWVVKATYYILCAHIVLQPLTLEPAIQANVVALHKMNGSSSTLIQLCDNLLWLLHISQSFTTKDLPSFGLFIMFFNICQLDLRNETSVALANLWWSIDKNQRSCHLVITIKSACVLNYLMNT